MFFFNVPYSKVNYNQSPLDLYLVNEGSDLCPPSTINIYIILRMTLFQE